MSVTGRRRLPSASLAEPEVAPDPDPWRRRVLLGARFLGLTLLMLRPSWHSLGGHRS